MIALAGALARTPGLAAADETPAVIRASVEAGELAALRWPRFPDYRPHLIGLYEPRGWAAVWLHDGLPTPAAAGVIATLAQADVRGLSPADYDAVWLEATRARLAAGPSRGADQGTFDTALSVAAMRYTSDAYIGRIDPRAVGFGLDVEPKKLDLVAFVDLLATADDPGARLAALDPEFALFRRLVVALAGVRPLAARTDLSAVPALATLRPGDRDAAVHVVRAWLAAWGDLPAGLPVPDDPHVYDPALVAAVTRFQERHGRDPDGVLGPATLRDLRVTPSARVRQIELAMERLRWLPPRLAGRFLVVNVPEYRLRGFNGGPGPELAMAVVVGSAARGTETPIMHADMRYVVFRPYWDVPASIARNEILPRAERDPSYLARERMIEVGGRVRQRPGPDNALGLVKFIFPNAYHVYLHDTPSKRLFSRSRRDFSHGCIRVADPVGLAEFLLGEAGWDRQRIEEAMREGPDDRRVNLVTPVPVYLLYSTVVAEQDGRLFFFDDVYGHDARLSSLLAKGYPYGEAG